MHTHFAILFKSRRSKKPTPRTICSCSFSKLTRRLILCATTRAFRIYSGASGCRNEGVMNFRTARAKSFTRREA